MKPRFTIFVLQRASQATRSATRPACALLRFASVFFLLALGFAPPTHAGETYTWNTDNGDWWVDPSGGPTNWLPPDGNPVGVGDIAIFPGRGHYYSPGLNMSPSISALYANSAADVGLSVAGRTLTLADGLYVNGDFYVIGGSGGTVRVNGEVSVADGASFYVQDGATLAMYGSTMLLDGPLSIRYGGTYGNAALACGADFSVEGPGELALDGASVVGPATLTNGGSHVIRGPNGTISAPVNNLGTIEANGGWMRLDTGAKTNSGWLRARGGGRLEIGNTVVTQGGGCAIVADGGTVYLTNGATVIDGQLSTSGGGVINVSGAIVTTLTDVDNLGELAISDGALVRVGGATTLNNGTIGVHYGGTYGGGQVEVLDPFIIGGTGDLYLTLGTLWGTGPLTSTAGHLIHGGGTSRIDVPIVNDSEIRADLPDLRLRAPVTNNSLVGAVAGGWMDIHGPTTITQTPDATVFADGGNVYLTGSAGIVGGKLNSAGGARIQTTGPVNDTLTDVTNLGEIYVGDGATLSLMGSSFVNQGTLGIHYGGTYGGANVAVVNSMTMAGAGNILFTNGNMWTNNGVTATNAADHTIRGGGGTFSGVLVNQGLIDADTLSATLSLRGEIANSGTLRARNGGRLDVHTCLITQTGGGKMVADGGNITVGGANITGGLFESSGASAFTANGGGINPVLSNLTNNATVTISDGATLTLSNSTIHDNGKIGVYYGGTYGNANLRISGAVTADGTGQFEFGGAYIYSDNGSSLTNGPAHLIHGGGATFEPQVFSNQGVVAADANNTTLYFRPGQVANSGIIKAADGGRLEIGASAITQTGAGQVFAESGGIGFTNGANITGGRLTCSGAYRFDAGAPMTVSLTNLTNDAEVLIRDGATLSLNGVITNNGPINIAYGGTYGGAHCFINSHTTLNGAGDLYISEGDLNCNGASVLINGSGHTLHGKGSWSGTFNNYGNLTSDLATITLNFAGPPCGNYGWMTAQGGYHFVLNNASAFENAGLMRLEAGSWMTVGGGSYRQTAGRTIVDGGIQLNGGPLDLAGGELLGGGTINGNVSNTGGTVAPGDPVAYLHISGSYTQGAAGRLHVEIAGTTPGSGHDVLAVGGVATLGGTIHITRAHCYAVPTGQPFTILTAGSRVGEFSHVVTPPGVAASVSYTATSVVVELTDVCEPGDLNCDGTVNIFDIQPFVEMLMPPHANPCSPCAGDTNQDGSINQFDINTFVECLIL